MTDHAQKPAVSTDFGRFCANWRIRVKDRRAHPYAKEFWPECLAVDQLSREQLLELRQSRLTELVNHAVQHVPFYKRWAKTNGFSVGDPVQIDTLPIVTKADFREDIDQFQSDAFDLATMGLSKTSGSSGEPFRFRTHRRAHDYSYCCLWRALSRAGLRPGMRRAYIWGTSWQFITKGLNVPLTRLRLKLRDWFNDTCSINAYTLTDENVSAAVAQLERFRPRYLHGYVSALYTIARHLLERGKPLKQVNLLAVVTESEKVYGFQHEAMREAFNCSVLEHYGSVEFGNLAERDVEGHMRVNDDMFWVEANERGEAIITNLMQPAYPFIRYKLGDLIEFAPEVAPGLPYTCLKQIVGRTVDLIPVPAGGYVHGVALAHVIDPHLQVVSKYQIHQQAIDCVVVRLITHEQLMPEAQQKIVADLKNLLGEVVDVKVELVDHIAPAKSGKYRWVISDVSDVAQRTFASYNPEEK